MKKIKTILCLSSFCIMIILFVFQRDIGAKINDEYKRTLLHQYFESEKTADLNVLESAAFCGKEEDSDKFVIWVGIAVQSDLEYGQLRKLTDKIYGSSLDVECIPYDREFANAHGFTGIQKETAVIQSAEGYYIIGITFEPKTFIDTRNKN